MTAVVMPLVEMVRDTLAALDYGTSVVVESSLGDFDDELKTRGELRIDVLAPTDPPLELADAATMRYEVAVDVVIRKRFDADDRALQDGRLLAAAAAPLVAIVEQVAEALIGERLTTSDGAWQETRIQALYRPDHLRQFSQFTGHVIVIFWAYKATS